MESEGGPKSEGEERERNTKQLTFRSGTGAHNCTMGRRRTHQQTTKHRSEDHWRRQTIALDHFFMKQNSVANSRTIRGESVTFIAVRKGRYQNITGSVVLKKGVEEPWAIERVVKLINLLG